MSEKHPDTHQDPYSKTIFGFWLYLLTDFVLFATIMAVYFVLRNSTYGGPSAAAILPAPFILGQTLLLLAVSFTVGIAGTFVHKRNVLGSSLLYGLTFVLGCLFLYMEFSGFHDLISAGNTWSRSAFLSGYFTLLGTHACHVIFALLWTLVLLPPIWFYGITAVSRLRLTALRMFWQFLNLIWIAIFTIIYLMGIS